jgi:hypothetical protein
VMIELIISEVIVVLVIMCLLSPLLSVFATIAVSSGPVGSRDESAL